MSLLDQFKQRKLVQWLLAYAAGAWLLLQVVGLIGAQFNWPQGLMRGFTIAAGIGFFVALLLAWYHGERGAQKVSGTELLLLTLLLLIGAGLLWQFAPGEPVATTPPNTASVAAPVEAPPRAAIDPRSIAVLPFVNMSTDIENGFFADGISEELLNVLAGVDGLKVASRTSAFSFKGKDTPIPEIARQLGVQHVLEGSVRKQGQRVRITAQLIKAGTDEHLWSETYDRELTDIFKVQEEIAQAITHELQGILGERQVSVAALTTNLDAYQNFLRGRARFNQRTDLLEAINDLSKAVELDPDFGEAWVYLAATWHVARGYVPENEIKASKANSEARTAMTRAAALVPEDPMLMAIQAQILGADGDFIGALALLQASATLSTQDSSPMMWRGQLLLLAGYVDEAIATLEDAQKLDPLSGVNNGYLAIAYLSSGQYEKAEAIARKAFAQGWEFALRVVVYDLAARGEAERALALFDESAPPAATSEQARRLAAAKALLADPANGDAFDILVADDGLTGSEFSIAINRFDVLLDSAERVQKQKKEDRRSQWWLRSAWMPSTLSLREDTRFFAFVADLGIVRLWEARGYPDGCKRLKAAGGDHLDCEAVSR